MCINYFKLTHRADGRQHTADYCHTKPPGKLPVIKVLHKTRKRWRLLK